MRKILSILMLCLVSLVQASPHLEKVNDKFIIENSVVQKSNSFEFSIVSEKIKHIDKYKFVIFDYRFSLLHDYLAVTTEKQHVFKYYKDFVSIKASDQYYLKNKLIFIKKEKLIGFIHIDPGSNIFTGVNC